MADQEIDKLLLEIDVDDKTQGGSKKLVDDFATAISKLNAEIAKLDVSKFEAISKAMSAISGFGGGNGTSKGGGIGKQSAELKKARKELAELTNAYEEYEKAGVKGDALASIYSQLGIDEAKKRVESLSAQSQSGGGMTLPEQTEQASKNTLELNSLLDVQKVQLANIQAKLKDKNLTEEEYIKLKKQELSLEKAMKGTGEKNLFSAIKRVAIYRAIRVILKAITNAFKEGFNNLAQFSDEVNQKMSQLQSSFTIIKNSVAVAFLPLLNVVTPLIQRISIGIAGLANTISYLSAKLSGNATYLKVNVDYLKKMNEQSRLLSFDTFEKLGGGNDVSGMFEEMQVSDGFGKVSEELNEVSGILTAISVTLGTIGALKIIKYISGGGLAKAIKTIGSSLETVGGQVGILVFGMALLAAGIADIVLSWNDVNFEGWEKAIVIVSSLIAGVVALVVAVKALKMPVAAAIGVGAALAGAVALIGTEVSKSTPKNYAFGGGYNSADLFYANENGKTELIASTNSGGGAVMNMQQLEGAIYSGMVKAMASGQNGESAIYLDGNKVGTFIAGNNGFRSEANRRNTGLNWR